jgi:hypothetical protein
MKEYKPVSNWVFIVPIVFFLVVTGFRSLDSNEGKFEDRYVDQIKTPVQSNIRQIECGFVQYNVTQNEEIKRITELVTRYCNGKEGCEIDHIF